MADQDKAFLESIVKTIVGNPDAVQVERVVDEMGVLLTLKIDPSDMGFVIGRRGQTAQAIRTLLKIVGARNNARVNLKIYDPEGENRRNNAGSERTERPERTERTERTERPATPEIDTSSVDDLKI